MGRCTYLRVSLTEKCNLNCGYCYGNSTCAGESPDRLSDDDLLKLIEAFSILGVNKVRFTGGEPLLRRGIVDLVLRTSKSGVFRVIGLTTNGVLLADMLEGLIQAGLNRLNVSLDSLDSGTYKRITGKDRLANVLEAIDLAEQAREGHATAQYAVA